MKNIVLKAITAIATILLIIAISAMDSENRTLPIVAMLASTAWIGMFLLANRRRWSD